MSINPDAYKRATYPPPLRSPQYLSDEDISYALDKLPRKRKPARPAASSPEAEKDQGEASTPKVSEA